MNWMTFSSAEFSYRNQIATNSKCKCWQSHSPLINCMRNFPLAELLNFFYKGLMLSLIRSSAFIYTGIHPVPSWGQWNDAVFTLGVNGVFITQLKGILQCINPKDWTISKIENLLMNDGKVTEMLNETINNSLRATNLSLASFVFSLHLCFSLCCP